MIGSNTRQSHQEEPREQFDEMGHAYITSMAQFPNARDEELELLAAFLTSASGVVMDYACGNGFLTARLLESNSHLKICGVDTSSVMLESYRKRFVSYEEVQAVHVNDLVSSSGGTFDLCLSLGGLHHIVDQVGAISGIRDRMRPGSSIVFADFEDGTASQRYFDELIHRYNSFGHVGFFVSRSRAENLARACRLSLHAYHRRIVTWRFRTKESMLRFVSLHHGLSCGPDIVETYLHENELWVEAESLWGIRHHYATLELRT